MLFAAREQEGAHAATATGPPRAHAAPGCAEIDRPRFTPGVGDHAAGRDLFVVALRTQRWSTTLLTRDLLLWHRVRSIILPFAHSGAARWRP